MNNEVKMSTVNDKIHIDLRLIENRIGYSILYKTRLIGHVLFTEQEVELASGEKKTITRLPAIEIIEDYQRMGVEEIVFDKLCRRDDCKPIRILAHAILANIGLYELMGFRIEYRGEQGLLVMIKE